MKQYVQDTGGRLVKGDDLLAIQAVALMAETFFAQFGSFIVSGCEVKGNSISSGIVMLQGKACTFDGKSGITFPFYVKYNMHPEPVAYESGKAKGRGYEIHQAVEAAASELDAFRLNDAPRFADIFKPKHAHNADLAANANRAKHADTAASADRATNAEKAELADNATNAANAKKAESADNATTAKSADKLGSKVPSDFAPSGFGLGGPGLQLASGTSLNTVTRSGFYRGTGLVNSPVVGWVYYIVTSHDDKWVTQLAISSGSYANSVNELFSRVCKEGVWSEWKQYIQTSTTLTEGDDLNNIQTIGFYHCRLNDWAEKISNMPTMQSKAAFSLLVEKHAGVKQTLTTYYPSAPSTWVRNFYGNVWGAWRRVIIEESNGDIIAYKK